MNNTRPYRLILPQQKRLRDAFATVMEAAGFTFERRHARRDDGILCDMTGTLPPIEARIRRPEDSLSFLSTDRADITILGLDTIHEFNLASGARENFRMTMMPGIAECRLSIAAKPSLWCQSPEDLSGARIATKYPETLRDWLDANRVEDVRILPCAGGAEDSVDMDLADAAFEIVESGTTLQAYGLEEKIRVMGSAAVLVDRPTTNKRRSDLTLALTERLTARSMVPA